MCSDGHLPPWPPVEEGGEGGEGGLDAIGFGGGGMPVFGPAPGIGLGHGLPKLVGKPVGVTGVRARKIAEGVCAVSTGLKVCRLNEQKKGKLAGSLEITLEIDGAGKVTSAKRTAGTIAAGTFATCVEKELGAATFDKLAKGTATWDLAVSASVRLIKVREKDVKIDGKLPPEVVRRIVRQSFPKFRACYDPVVKNDPDAKGVVFVDYVIDAKGTPKQVKESGSTLGDATARACIKKVFDGLSYPDPEAGVVKVHYGIELSFDLE